MLLTYLLTSWQSQENDDGTTKQSKGDCAMRPIVPLSIVGLEPSSRGSSPISCLPKIFPCSPRSNTNECMDKSVGLLRDWFLKFPKYMITI